MKIRNGFVSNSSSSSFIVFFKHGQPIDPNSLRHFLFGAERIIRDSRYTVNEIMKRYSALLKQSGKTVVDFSDEESFERFYDIYGEKIEEQLSDDLREKFRKQYIDNYNKTHTEQIYSLYALDANDEDALEAQFEERANLLKSVIFDEMFRSGVKTDKFDVYEYEAGNDIGDISSHIEYDVTKKLKEKGVLVLVQSNH